VALVAVGSIPITHPNSKIPVIQDPSCIFSEKKHCDLVAAVDAPKRPRCPPRWAPWLPKQDGCRPQESPPDESARHGGHPGICFEPVWKRGINYVRHETPPVNSPQKPCRIHRGLPNRSRIVAGRKETPGMNQTAIHPGLPKRVVAGLTWTTISVETIFDVFGIEHKRRLVE
jgi:hypothetical protein